MASFHGGTGNGKYGVLTSEQAKLWILSKLKFQANSKFVSNLQSSLNDIENNRGKATGNYKYAGENILHASSGKIKTSHGCSLFWIVRPGDVAKLVAVGEHINSKTYDIYWRSSDWGFSGNRLSLL